ncbi:alkaline phosphatase PhoX [Nonomuraea thailandensis]
MTELDRRSFLGRGLATTGGVLASGIAIETLTAHASWASAGRPAGDPGETGYGPLRRMPARNTGEEFLALPAGFSYVVLGRSGTLMTDGVATPIAHDGMAAFPGTRRHTVRLIRNHEVRTTPGSPSAGCTSRARGATTSWAWAAPPRWRSTCAAARCCATSSASTARSSTARAAACCTSAAG